MATTYVWIPCADLAGTVNDFFFFTEAGTASDCAGLEVVTLDELLVEGVLELGELTVGAVDVT